MRLWIQYLVLQTKENKNQENTFNEKTPKL
jgi:hypothetical protein